MINSKKISLIKLAILLVLIVCVIILLYKFCVYKENLSDEKRVTNVLPQIQKIYYINLEKRVDRNEEFLSNFTLQDQMIIQRINALYTPEDGNIGCLMSHIKALHTFIHSHAKVCMVCEDDLLIYDIDKMNKCVLKVFEVFPNWDVIMIASNTVYDEHTNVFVGDIEVKRILDAQTASGYIINKNYGVKLLKKYIDSYNIYKKTGKFDSSLCSDQCWKSLQREGNWYSFTPRLAKQRKSYSDIQKGNVNYECYNKTSKC